MKRIIILILIFSFQILYSINSNIANGEDVSSPQREDLYYNHNNQHDLNWYGSDRWAVEFDFAEPYNNIDSLEMNVEGVRIYLPQLGNDITLKFFDCYNDLSSADSVLASEQVYAEDLIVGWNDIPLSNPLNADTLFVVIEYPTYNGMELAASAIDGTHSYYFEDEYFKNMAANGFDSELLVSVYGDMHWNFDTDLGISNFEMVKVDTLVHPKFKIKNNSISEISDISFTYYRTTPESYGRNISLEYNYTLDSPLASGEEREILIESFTDTLFTDYLQYNYTIQLSMLDDAIPSNNTVDFMINVFANNCESHLVENFVKLDDYNSTHIWDYQDNQEYSNLDIQTINYFPFSNDYPFYQLDVMQRYNYYELGTIPVTIINATKKIFGYSENNEAVFATEINSEKPKTFLSIENIYGTKDVMNGMIQYTVMVRNDSTYVFSSYLGNSYFHVAVVEYLVNENEIFGSVFRTSFDKIAINELSYNNSARFENYFNSLAEINTIEETGSFENCRLVYWIQNEITNDILLLGEIDFNQFEEVGTEENNLSSNLFLTYKNPSSCNEIIELSLMGSRSFQKPTINIYNIKGQKVVELSPSMQRDDEIIFTWDGKDATKHSTASGIYLLQLSDKNKTILNKKMLRLQK
jgi:hypothetical protein